jgi:hypothetical protein
MNNLRKAFAILAPIDVLIIKYQFDKVPISEVMPDFHNLLKEYKKVMSSNIITPMSLNTWLSWHNDASSSCTALLTVCRICSTHDTLETGCLRIHEAA